MHEDAFEALYAPYANRNHKYYIGYAVKLKADDTVYSDCDLITVKKDGKTIDTWNAIENHGYYLCLVVHSDKSFTVVKKTVYCTTKKTYPSDHVWILPAPSMSS